MNKNIAIKVERLSKRYRIQAVKPGFTFVDVLTQIGKPKPKSEDFWALKDVSFEVKQGEVLGVIGKNGSGKSTLLKILSRITEPTEGKVTMRGRVASLLEVGTGFNPELSGRENVFLNGAILGMSRKEIARKFDEIVDFAGVEKFIDTPVKRYSSGMYVRLAFAVAAHLDADILLVDEVLAVGDMEFQKKCLKKMETLAGSGKAVIIVSHALEIIQTLAVQGLHLNQGKVTSCGDINQVIKSYFFTTSSQLKEFPDRNNSVAWIKKITIKQEKIEITFQATKRVKGLFVALGLFSGSVRIWTGYSCDNPTNEIAGLVGLHTIQATLPLAQLKSGFYRIGVALGSLQGITYDSHMEEGLMVEVNHTEKPIFPSQSSTIPGFINYVSQWSFT